LIRRRHAIERQRFSNLRLAIDKARFLRERFVPDYNARFAVPAAEPGSAFVPYVGRRLAMRTGRIG
jgi:hypothetical protein